jgi:preprotein translocase subunit YajC
MESTLYAMAPNGASQPGQPAPSGPAAFFASPLPLLALMALFFYFMILRPQQKQAKQRQEMIKAIKAGDQVITASGIFATVVKVNDDDTLQLRIAENVAIKATRQSVDSLAKK